MSLAKLCASMASHQELASLLIEMERECNELRKDAERYRWLRDLLAVEDIARLVDERAQYPWSKPDPAESAKTDEAVDEAMADCETSGASAYSF